MERYRRPLLAVAAAAALLPLAACYDDGYAPIGYGAPPPPPPAPGYYAPPPPPGYYAPPAGYDAPPPPPDGYDRDYDRPRGELNQVDPRRDYRDEPGRERALGRDDRVYRGQDGRYYCRRSDGSTGLVVGAVAGGILGNLLDGGHNRVLGTLLGGGGGALLGKSIDQGQVRCR